MSKLDLSYIYAVQRVVRIVDGDTVDVELFKRFELPVDFGFHIKDNVVLEKKTTVRFRLGGINAPETKGTTREAGLLAKSYLGQWMPDVPTEELRLLVQSYRQDKYGRWLGVFYKVASVERALGAVEDHLEGTTDPRLIWTNINQELVKAGHAVPYMEDSL